MIEEKICIHTDQEINHNNVEGNLRKIYLKSHENIVFAESFFSNQVIKKIPKFGQLEHEPLGKFLFSNSNFQKKEILMLPFMNKDMKISLVENVSMLMKEYYFQS